MDTILRGAKVIDGSGAPAVQADIALSNGKIVEVGQIGRNGAVEIDLDGLVLAPGFIDIHTHLDAQVLWDPDLTPSCWHGVTTTIMGNCGFGIAPLHASQRDLIARTLENVEGMSYEALSAGIPWSFETFPEYLDALDRTPKRLNVGAMIGHTPIRLYVMGGEAAERAATEPEIAQMRQLVSQAMDMGAFGFTTDQNTRHKGAGGGPVPSALSTAEEIISLGSALTDAGRGIIELSPGPVMDERSLPGLSKRLGRPVTYAAMVTGRTSIVELQPGKRGAALGLMNELAAAGGEVWPQVSCRPVVLQVTLTDPSSAFTGVPAFKEILSTPRAERTKIYADPQWRERARPDVEKSWSAQWSKISLSETRKFPELRGLSLPEIAGLRGSTPFDVFIDLALAEDLQTRYDIIIANGDREELADLLRDRRTLLGAGDAGAHASQLCDACYPTYLLGHWVRERGVLDLEQAVWRMTGHPAQIFGLHGRGLIRPGFAADLVAFDPATVGPQPAERVYDLPTNADRLIVRSTGIEYVWVNGQIVRQRGNDLPSGAPGGAPGKLLRGGRNL